MTVWAGRGGKKKAESSLRSTKLVFNSAFWLPSELRLLLGFCSVMKFVTVSASSRHTELPDGEYNTNPEAVRSKAMCMRMDPVKVSMERKVIEAVCDNPRLEHNSVNLKRRKLCF